MRLNGSSNAAEAVAVRRLADRLLSLLGEYSVEIASIALIEANVRLLKAVNHCSTIKACNDLILVIEQMKESEGNTHGNV